MPMNKATPDEAVKSLIIRLDYLDSGICRRLDDRLPIGKDQVKEANAICTALQIIRDSVKPSAELSDEWARQVEFAVSRWSETSDAVVEAWRAHAMDQKRGRR